MVQLSTRARRELAIMHAADAMRILAAAAIPLHLLPFGAVLFLILTVQMAWLGFFLAWCIAQVTLHLSLVRAADTLLDQTRPQAVKGLVTGTLLLALAVAGQAAIAGTLGTGFLILVLITCGLFDLVAFGALVYVFVATWRALHGRLEEPVDRHVGFEVVLPFAKPVPRDLNKG